MWVAGCSSGEEAYSIAIAIQEQIEAFKADCKVQIYATDLDEQAITAARRGIYSGSSIENLSAKRLERFFKREDDGYQVKKNIRDLVVFSTHNLISDPPFSRIDLLTCRNVLIYLEQELQNQLFLQFHYALNPDGFLFLGTSESIGPNKDLFAVIDRKYKLFQRKEAVTLHHVHARARFTPPKVAAPEAGGPLIHPMDSGLRAWTERMLLEFHTPACVVIDQKHTILYVHGHTGKYLEPAEGETSTNLVRMAREGLKTELATALHIAISRKETVRREGILVKTDKDYQAINLTIQPVARPPDMPDLIMVVFEDVAAFPKEIATDNLRGKGE